MSETDGDLTGYLAEHPRMAGAILTILLVLSQAGTAAGKNAAATIG